MKVILAVIFFATFFIAGCAVPTRATSQIGSETPSWHGRLAIQIEADSISSPAQSFSAEFELTGTPVTGELTLFTPLGSTAATLTWTPQSATMRSNSDTRTFESLEALIRHAVGTDIPVVALFAWLAGNDLKVAGWSADLSKHAVGRISARRTEPAPMAELRLVLEK
ncbi:MAG: lipoprotein insertase outer membrane protein LolB [Rhodoferax sp.]|uniref:lipoprotein insertase outer membrane protein LolB n=1 Tax=Rhodoferax sp. TaxID=50421 RepID=UPI00301AD474